MNEESLEFPIFFSSAPEKRKETDLDVGVGFSNETFSHEQNATCLVTHTLDFPSTKATIRVF